jgi:hypothetical protein
MPFDAGRSHAGFPAKAAMRDFGAAATCVQRALQAHGWILPFKKAKGQAL